MEDIGKCIEVYYVMHKSTNKVFFVNVWKLVHMTIFHLFCGLFKPTDGSATAAVRSPICSDQIHRHARGLSNDDLRLVLSAYSSTARRVGLNRLEKSGF